MGPIGAPQGGPIDGGSTPAAAPEAPAARLETLFLR
jgi:hypothetical protein